MSTELKTQIDPFALALPVTVVKHPNAGKVILEDDNGEWLCDVHSRKAYSLAAALNDLPRLRSLADAGEKVAEALVECRGYLSARRSVGELEAMDEAGRALSEWNAAKSQSEPVQP